MNCRSRKFETLDYKLNAWIAVKSWSVGLRLFSETVLNIQHVKKVRHWRGESLAVSLRLEMMERERVQKSGQSKERDREGVEFWYVSAEINEFWN